MRIAGFESWESYNVMQKSIRKVFGFNPWGRCLGLFTEAKSRRGSREFLFFRTFSRLTN